MMRFMPAVLAGAAALALLSGCVVDDYYDGYGGSYGGAGSTGGAATSNALTTPDRNAK